MSADLPIQEAVKALSQRHSQLAAAGLRGIEPGDPGGEPYLLARVDEGFGSDRLPAVFMGLPVVMDDGARTYKATGEAA